jgi:hypothetical protein
MVFVCVNLFVIEGRMKSRAEELRTSHVRTAQIERLKAYTGHAGRKIAGIARAALEAHRRGDVETMARINVEMTKHILKRIAGKRTELVDDGEKMSTKLRPTGNS